MMKIIKTLGSLYLAIFLISALALILIASTTLESLYGTPFAQRFFYNAGWFDVLLGAFFVNIFCSTLTRWPFKKYHTGFVITHVGILLLLAGSLMTRLVGIDGQMALFEGETQDRILQNTYHMVIHRHDASHNWTGEIDLKSSALSSVKLHIPDTSMDIMIEDIWDDAVDTYETVQGPPNAPTNPAIQITLSSERVGLHDSLWLVVNNPLNPDSAQVSMGPATVSLKTKKPRESSSSAKTSGPSVIVSQNKTGKEFVFSFDPLPKTPLALGDTGLKITKIEYFPDARVENNKLVTISGEPKNPAVEFTVADAAGQSERHTKFALFPDFESLHGKNAQSRFDLTVSMETPEAPEAPAGGLHANLTFYYLDGKWSFISKGTTGGNSGAVEIGKTYTTGWMDFSFRIEQLLDKAVVRRLVRHAQTGEKGGIAALVSLKENGRTLASDWITSDQPFRFESEGGPIVAVVETKNKSVPFNLQLDEFRKVDYPGTSNAASFESDVTLKDNQANITIKKTISMNKPLDYKGYRIFQSSYVQDPRGGPDTSIFTVAKNPGIWLIYGGAIVMFTGVILIFYVKPLSPFSQVNGKGRKK